MRLTKTTHRTHTNQAVTRALRSVAMLVVALLLSSTAALVSAPPAAAQTSQASEADEQVRFSRLRLNGTRCGDGYTSYPSGIKYRDGSGELFYCVEVGFTNVTSKALCEQAVSVFRNAAWVADYGVCVYSQTSSVGCPPPLFPFQWTAGSSGEIYDGCFIPVMSNADAIARIGQTAAVITTPACIESDVVQDHDAVASLVVGSHFRGADDGVLYTVVTGTGCTFGCFDGFDANCDGKIGDFCAVELDRHKASDVSICLDTLDNTDRD